MLNRPIIEISSLIFLVAFNLNWHIKTPDLRLTQSRYIDSNSNYTFQSAVNKLKEIGYYVSGKNNHVISVNPDDFVELNGIKNCFAKSFNSPGAGLLQLKGVLTIEKFHVAKNKRQKGPSATIIKIKFPNLILATEWFEKLKSCPDYPVIKLKPKTEIWQSKDNVYLVQSYYDSDRGILNTILNKLKPLLT